MKLMFIGADHEVTGSCHYLEAAGLKILVDCGMKQGVDYFENAELPVSYSEIDYVLLTHAHIDHAGMFQHIHCSSLCRRERRFPEAAALSVPRDVSVFPKAALPVPGETLLAHQKQKGASFQRPLSGSSCQLSTISEKTVFTENWISG